jgi:hypothetical protein
MRRIDLNITDCLTVEDKVVIHGTIENSSDTVEIVIPVRQIPAIVGVLEEPKKKGGK